MSRLTEAEFERLPYASRMACKVVRFDGDVFFVLTFRLTASDREAGEPAADQYVTFAVDRASVRTILRDLGRTIDDVESL